MFRLINVIIPKNELTLKKYISKEKKGKKKTEIKLNFVNIIFFFKTNFSP